MGLDVLLAVWVVTWMLKTATQDVAYAVTGKPNPRYELKKQRAAQAGRPAKSQPRYGTREWAADLYSDALAAHTEKRRKAAKAKGQPVDDMVELVREPRTVPTQRHPHDPNNTRNCPTCKGEVVLDGRPCPTCLAEQKRRNAEWEARHETPEPPVPPRPTPQPQPEPDTRPLAPVINLFPDVQQIEKEITMSSEVTGLPTAVAFADAASSAHQSFATTGAEGYVGALERGGMSGAAVASAREAMEASGIAADKWAAHRALLEQQTTLKEAYQSQPDAADKEFLLAE